jgi:hypothetical protein
MGLGSFSSGALYELENADIDRMVGLDETLFVEHKAGIGEDESFKLLQAIAAFANTAGGWVLLGIHEGKIVATNESVWAAPGAPQLVDMVRDRLRGRLDPLPAFEAKVIEHHGGPVGVVRVYESSDTPHTALQNGAVYVREVAGVRDAKTPKRSGTGALAERAYRAVTIGSRADLLQLAARGQIADQRVSGLVNTPYLSPLVAKLGLQFHPSQSGTRAIALDHGLVHVRIAPYTLPTRFRRWATTLDAAGAVLRAAEDLANHHGLTSDWVTPHPAGASIEVPHTDPAPHADTWSRTNADAIARAVIDGEGIAGAALKLDPPRLRRSPSALRR